MKLSNLHVFLLLGVVFVLTKFRGAIGGVLVDLVKNFEGISLSAYRDPGGVWTIGYGLTRYPNGQPVQPGDIITLSQAEKYFAQTLSDFSQGVENLLLKPVNNNQFSALVSLAYNIGLTAFRNSTLLSLVNENPNNPLIRAQFMRWVYDNGTIVQGLVNRRTAEADLYFS